MNSPTISVILPFYNSASTLRQAIKSILEQKDVSFELILINDGSVDDSLAIAQEMSDEHVVILSQENKGLSAALNRGLESARGEYIARMDADDVARRGRLALQARYLDVNSNVVLVGGQIARLVEDRVLSVSTLPMKHEFIKYALLEGRHALCHPTVMFRKDAACKVGGYWDSGVAEDWDFYLKMTEVGAVANLSDTLLDYRYHPHSINSKSLSSLRLNIALAIENAGRREAGLRELDRAEFAEGLSRRRRLMLQVEVTSHRLYRASLASSVGGSRLARARSCSQLALAATLSPRTALSRIRERLGSRDANQRITRVEA